MLVMMQMQSRHLSVINDMQTRFGPKSVSKSLTDGRKEFDVRPTHMRT